MMQLLPLVLNVQHVDENVGGDASESVDDIVSGNAPNVSVAIENVVAHINASANNRLAFFVDKKGTRCNGQRVKSLFYKKGVEFYYIPLPLKADESYISISLQMMGFPSLVHLFLYRIIFHYGGNDREGSSTL
ncbi:hypothetical protein I6N90_19260 [Paenibacillus sp. GSMTC-2017]|uniref:hypothetical protein n=1 Tax=Paenibacillus sp. GSMTC-2017 TaxID=2794350 RepID=UPI0018D6B4E1|nr:hypothetical protein [Paenibacillus sp. GSMTC-2017]MBH5319942.1 hypothetical protein [Paenibacillus sp. GSMTC-2017]